MKIKSLLSALFFFALLIGFTSCSNDDSPASLSTQVNLTVNKDGQPASGVDVYLFKKVDVGVNSFDPFYANKKLTTGAEGMVVFELNENGDLSAQTAETTLYFKVFDEADNVLGETDVTINKGETKNATISY
ncbi:hypothetical protein [Flammeovirga aprica]|uniref:Type 1 periplasmic binding fold superfamily protein n=1 Tax=Flammeovirga aprica JL-4 TaxID=694437 RepID=A0A7X9X9Y1_9BACT|nr:hypothetical protein [Flammeovirga aprica]NME69133.1 hypothetical protein [Flammeovirga aprica JL-4]